VGFVIVLVIGLLIGAFGWYAGVTTGTDVYNELGCGENIFNRSPEMEKKCSAATGGQWIGIGAWILASIFIIVGFIGSIVTGVKLALDSRHSTKDAKQQ